MHRHSEGAEAHIDKFYPILDYGHIALTDYMGNDIRIAEAARQSTTGDTKGPEQDRKLIRYMLDCSHRPHTSPFEMVETIWKIKMPIVVARQWVRHRTASLNEYSGRYSVMPDEAYLPSAERLKHGAQNTVNKQGSVASELSDEEILQIQSQMGWDQAEEFEHYHDYLDAFEMSKELSRMNLPLGTYTTWMWKIDLHNLMHFLWLRLDGHAMWEIRQYAEKMWEIVQDGWPMAAEAFYDFKLHAKTISRMQIKELMDAVREDAADGTDSSVVAKVVDLFAEAEADKMGSKALFSAREILLKE